MKKLLLLLLCALTMIGMLSCGTVPTGNEIPVTDTDTAAEQDPPTAVIAFDPDSAYAAILTECRDLLSADADSTEYPDGLLGVHEAAVALGAEAMDTIGYVFRDLNEDTIPELLIGSFDKPDDAYTKNEIYAAYTHNGKSPVLLFSGWARNSYALTDENTLYHHGSGGAAYSIFGEYRISEAGEFQCINAYFTYPKDDEMTEIGFYRNTSGIMDPAEAEEWAVSADEFWAAGDAIAAKTTKLSAVPFSAYVKPSADPA